MFCQNCGHEVDDKAVICVNCGNKLTPSVNETKPTGFKDFLMYCPLVLGIASIVLCWTGFGFLLAIATIVLAIVLKSSEGKEAAKKHYFTAGIVCAIISIVINVLILLVSLLLLIVPSFFFFEELEYLSFLI